MNNLSTRNEIITQLPHRTAIEFARWCSERASAVATGARTQRAARHAAAETRSAELFGPTSVGSIAGRVVTAANAAMDAALIAPDYVYPEDAAIRQRELDMQLVELDRLAASR